MKNKPYQWILLTASALVVSCSKDAAYDDLTKSDGIDLTVSIANNGLTIPMGSVDTVYLTELIKTDERNITLGDDNIFYIKKDGSFKSTKVSVDVVDFEYIPDIEPRFFKLDAVTEMTPSMHMLVENTAVGETLDAIDNNPSYSNTFDLTCKDIYLSDSTKMATYTIDATHVDNDLLAINTAWFKKDIKTTFKMEIYNLPNPSEAYNVILHGITLQMPDYVVARNPAGEEYTDGFIDDLGAHGSQDVLLTKKAGEDFIRWESDKIIISGGQFKDKPLINNNGSIYRSDDIIMTSEVEIPQVTMEGKELMVALDKSGEKIIQYKNKVVVYTYMSSMEGVIDSIRGRFYPEIEPLSKNVEIDVSDDLNFLKKEGAELDVKNPTLGIVIKNPCEIKLSSDFNVNSDNDKHILIEDVNITPKKNIDTIDIQLTADVEDRSNNIYSAPALSTLMQPLPEEVDLYIKAYSDSVGIYPYKLGKDIPIRADYNINVPFEFNRVKFVYDKVAEDVFDEEITDYLSVIKEAAVRFDIQSTLPIETKTEVVGRNHEGIEDASLVQSSVVSIQRSTTGEPVLSPVEIKISIDDIKKVKDLVIKMTGEGDDCTLKGTQYLRFENVRLQISQLTLDLNDK